MKNRDFEFWHPKYKNIDNLRLLFCRAPNFTSFGVFRLHSASRLLILENFEYLPFLPKVAKHDVTKTPFSQKVSVNFYEVSVEDVKLMLDKVLTVPR